MKKIIFISLTVITLVTGIVTFVKLPTFNSFIRENILMNKEEAHEEVPTPNIVFILDGSGSTSSQYAVPKVGISYLDNLVRQLEMTGKGRLWVTYIDANSQDNEVSYINILETPKMETKPQRKSGEMDFNYNKRVDEWSTRYAVSQKDSVRLMDKYSTERQEWYTKTEDIITKAYSKRKKGGDYSDVIGATQNGIRILSSIEPGENANKWIVLVSDADDDVGKKMDFNTIPADIHILVVSNGGSGSKNSLAKVSTEVDNLERVKEIILKK